MEWNVYYYNMNSHKIAPFNIFNHSRFRNDIQKAFKKCKTKDEFIERLESDLFYYFGFKAEYEIILAPWCGEGDKESIKIDIYSQIMLNWDKVVEYVWSCKGSDK